jgi:N-carbamoyl-L-amino-acid hydrolase
MAETADIRIDPDRLWRSLMDMARLGATPKGGVCRLTLTDTDRQARDLFAAWCRESNLEVRIDAMGNMFARRPGTDPGRAPILLGSHLDSQPSGGKFDGALGVLAALEVVRALNDNNHATAAPVEIVNWTNEEGARFAPAMIGSAVFTGEVPLDEALTYTDPEDRTIGGELRRIAYAGDADRAAEPVDAYFELHIEQGPILEDEGKTIGVVTGVQGVRWYDVTFTGQDAHAGPTPMNQRRDALLGAAEAALAINGLGCDFAPHGRSTVGVFEARPNSRNVVPGGVSMSVDMRHPDAEALADMDRRLRDLVVDIADARSLEATLDEIWYSPPVAFDAACVAMVRDAAEGLGFGHRDITSGAGHDAVLMARVHPTAMVFVPCEDGISHAEIEHATPEDCAAGGNVLLHAVLARAG